MRTFNKTIVQKTSFQPSQEQVEIVEEVQKGNNVCIEAFAGAGKTKTLTLLADSVPDKNILMICFNKSIQLEAEKRFPSNVTCQTINSIAWRDIIKSSNSKLGKKLGSNFILDEIDTNLTVLTKEYEELDIEVKIRVRELMDGFCNSSYMDVGDYLDNVIEENEDFNYLLMILEDYWQDIINPNSNKTITHSVYLKLFQLKNPILNYDVILVDEFQDFSPVNLAIVETQLSYGKQILVVGDKWQCLVEGTLVDGIPIEQIKVGDIVNSFAGGNIVPKSVTKTYSKYIEEDIVSITTSEGIINSTKNHIHFATNLPTKHGYVVYLMYKEGVGYRIGRTQQFRQRCSEEGATYCWILNNFLDNILDAAIFEQVTSFTFGIPTLIFKCNGGKEYPQEYYDKVFASIDTETNAKKLLTYLGLDINKPHYVPQAVGKDKITLTISMLADIRGQAILHKYYVTLSQNQALIFKEKYPHYNIRPAKGSNTFRIESSTKDLGVCYTLYEHLYNVFPQVELNELANINKGKCLKQLPAINVTKGMFMQNHSGDLIEVLDTKIIPYKGYVYDLDIDKTHNFIANGIVTHNSIYAFRGATDAFGLLHKIGIPFSYKKLTTSYRFGDNIAKLANDLLFIAGEDTKLIGGNTNKDSEINSIAYIYRNNINTLGELVNAAEKGLKVKYIGDLKDLWSKGYHITALLKDEKPKYPNRDLACYKNKKQLLAAAMKIQEVKTLLGLVQYINNNGGVYKFSKMIENVLVKEDEKEDITISTIHKSKGLEFDKVYLGEDCFPINDNLSDIEVLKDNQTLELIYIGITRAIKEVVLPLEVRRIINHKDILRNQWFNYASK